MLMWALFSCRVTFLLSAATSFSLGAIERMIFFWYTSSGGDLDLFGYLGCIYLEHPIPDPPGGCSCMRIEV